MKTQETLLETIHFYFESKGKWQYAEAEHEALELHDFLEGHEDVKQVSFTGVMRRKLPVIDKIDILVSLKKGKKLKEILREGDAFITNEMKTPVLDIPVVFQETDEDNWVADLIRATGNEEHLQLLKPKAIESADTEEAVYKKSGLPYIIPEMREGRGEENFSAPLEDIVEMKHLRGCIHNHSLWSDGGGTIEQMAQTCMDMGLEYFGISDHSQTASYAGGLPPKKVLAQMKEVDKLNEKLAPFKIFKGIESDILADGSLDYDDDILKLFDYVVASVHSGQKMTEKEANARLIRAIENPYTTILGHMTGRLLLIRKGYPVDHKKIIDACADNGVVIEINANPRRLDMDWHWYDYAMKKDVMLSINPDGHDMSEIPNMYYGVCVARKGGVTYDRVLNALSLEEVEKFFNKKKSHRA
jgi:DNA polymerase (family 10)